MYFEKNKLYFRQVLRLHFGGLLAACLSFLMCILAAAPAQAATELVTQYRGSTVGAACSMPPVLTQTITFPSAGSYTFSVQVKSFQVTNLFRVTLDGNDLVNLTNITDTAYQTYTLAGTVSAGGSKTLVVNVCSDDGSVTWRSLSILFASSVTTTTAATNDTSLRAIQVAGTAIVSATSTAAIGQLVDAGILAGFTGSGGPNLGPAGGFISFGDAYDRSDSSDSARAILDRMGVDRQGTGLANPAIGSAPVAGIQALGFSDPARPSAVASVAPRKLIDREWSAWAGLRGSGWNASGGNSSTGEQLNIVAGAGRRFDNTTLAGVFAGYENFNYRVASLNGRFTGDGATIGVYAAKRIDNVQLDARLGWSSLNYLVSTDKASGRFKGSRWLAAAGLSANKHLGDYTNQPTAKVSMTWEKQSAWRDSLGNPQSELNPMSGKVSLGANLGRTFALSDDWIFSPYLGLYADWRFMNDAARRATNVANIGGGLSASATLGLTFLRTNGLSFNLNSELAGIGASYKSWSGTISLRSQF